MNSLSYSLGFKLSRVLVVILAVSYSVAADSTSHKSFALGFNDSKSLEIKYCICFDSGITIV